MPTSHTGSMRADGDGFAARTTDAAADDLPLTAIGDDLLVVSNRQPYRHEYADDGDRITVERPKGGLTAGLDGVLRQVGGTWIAWGDGDADAAVTAADGRVAVPPDAADGQYALDRVWLSDEQVEQYYYGYSNRVLWPICHSALTEIHCDVGYWDQYRGVNELFADAVCDAADAGSVVWFQDYHLALAPQFASKRLPESAFVGYTWHIPWPSWDVFRACPHAREILRGLLATDLLTFHVERYCENFLQCVATALPEARIDWEANRVVYGDGATTVRAFPMGVAADRISHEARSPAAEAFWPDFCAEHGIGEETHVAVGVDRLDYSKGIDKRVAALERLWAAQPQWRESLTYVQVATESRSRIPAYHEYQTTVEDAVARVNERFGTEDWTPIVYTTASLEDEELYSIYSRADVGLVTPIRDGMNLVAQEYVAAQQRDDGALVLSDQAGAHDVLSNLVVSTSPQDLGDLAGAIQHALTLPPDERRSRMHGLRRRVAENDLRSWLTAVLDTVEALREPRERRRMPAGA